METPATRPRCDAPQHEAERQAKPARRCPPYLGLLRRHPRGLQREQEASPYVFVSERGGPMTPKSFGTLFWRLGQRAGMPFQVFPHMLRHACGYALANAGHDTRALQAWLGHKNIQHTVRYTELAPDRFQELLAIGVTSAAGAAAPRTRPFRTIQV